MSYSARAYRNEALWIRTVVRVTSTGADNEPFHFHPLFHP